MLRNILTIFAGLFFIACGNAKTDALQESSSSLLPQDSIVQEELIEEYRSQTKEIQDDDLRIVYFAFDSFTLSKEMFDVINFNAELLKKDTQTKIILEGNTDAYGSDEYNFALGNKRALAVKEALLVRGINKDRIATVSYGETKPVCLELTKECRAKNRRVNFVVKK